MEIRLSRRHLRRLRWLLLPIALIALALLGRARTPRDAAGNPLLLSPSLKSTLEYRGKARAWVEDFHVLDGELEALLTEGGDIYHQTQAVDGLLNRSIRLAEGIELSRAPAALAGLRTMLSGTSLAYLEAARAVADWVGAPTPDRLAATETAMSEARDWLAQTEVNRWLQEPEPDSDVQALEGTPEPDADEEGGW